MLKLIAPVISSDTTSDITFPVETIRSVTIFDTQRRKELELKAYLPAEKNNCPVIVFSHGAGASKDAYARLARFWCSRGYAVILPTHDDSIVKRRKEGRPDRFEDILEEIKTDYEGWKNRARDLTFIIRSLSELALKEPRIKGKLDGNLVGLGGHSYGAFAAMLAAGVSVHTGSKKKLQLPKTHNVKALLLLSPAGASDGSYGLSPSSFSGLTVPLMTMTGSADPGLHGQPAEWRTESYKFAPPGDKYLVFIQGATHISFTGSTLKGFLGTQEIKTFDRRLAGWLAAAQKSGSQDAGGKLTTGNQNLSDSRIFKCINDASLAFWDAYLKHKQDKLEYLYSQQSEFRVNNAVTFSRK